MFDGSPLRTCPAGLHFIEASPQRDVNRSVHTILYIVMLNDNGHSK